MLDARFLKTRQRYFDALEILLKEQNFESIRISDLVREAKTTRKTFYNHYQDKIELIVDYQEELTKEIFAIQKEHTQLDENYFYRIITLLRQKGALLSALLNYNGSLELQSMIKSQMVEACLLMLSDKLLTRVKRHYQAHFMANAIFGTLQYYLTLDYDRPSQEVAAIIAELVAKLNIL